MEISMTNRKTTKSAFRAFVEQLQHADRARKAFARVLSGKEVRRRDAGVLRTLARG
jgi:hypothetical protein